MHAPTMAGKKHHDISVCYMYVCAISDGFVVYISGAASDARAHDGGQEAPQYICVLYLTVASYICVYLVYIYQELLLMHAPTMAGKKHHKLYDISVCYICVCVCAIYDGCVLYIRSCC
jgi:hypothetical protein